MVPDAEVLPGYAKSELGLNITDMTELCSNDKVKQAIIKGMATAAKTFNIKGFEQVHLQRSTHVHDHRIRIDM